MLIDFLFAPGQAKLTLFRISITIPTLSGPIKGDRFSVTDKGGAIHEQARDNRYMFL
jgi:hypothetical protein